MSVVQNFSFLAGLEVREKFVGGGGGGFQVSTMSNPITQQSCFYSCFGLS